MRYASAFLFSLVCASAWSQVTVDKPILLSAPDPADRRVEGLAPADDVHGLVTVGAAQDGSLITANVSGTPNALLLALQPPTGAYVNGLHVRWISANENTSAVTVDVDGLGAVPLRDRTGLPLAAGALRAGVVAEAQFADSVFVLLGAASSGCPAGFLQVNAHLCIMQSEGPLLNWFEASAYCSDRGGSLCTWDQYLFACQAYQGQLTGMFNNWEWIDDTSDHTHSADQIGRFTCLSMFNISASFVDLGITRCCYPLR